MGERMTSEWKKWKNRLVLPLICLALDMSYVEFEQVWDCSQPREVE
ncbi:hypothetical protein [Ammoniphilus oxalaticus]|nr:hypothetical protein [Ammoniphilus oxalaticus]